MASIMMKLGHQDKDRHYHEHRKLVHTALKHKSMKYKDAFLTIQLIAVYFSIQIGKDYVLGIMC